MKNPSLKSILKYKNDNVIGRFSQDFGLSKKESEIIFKDCLAFLWLSGRLKHLQNRNSNRTYGLKEFSIKLPFYVVDEMWHTFLIFSRDYEKFSEKYFGGFLHHQPEAAAASSKNRRSDQEEFQAYLNFIYDELGRNTFRRWFIIYPKKYSKKKLFQRKLRTLK